MKAQHSASGQTTTGHELTTVGDSEGRESSAVNTPVHTGRGKVQVSGRARYSEYAYHVS